MATIKYLPTREIKPVVNLMVERHKFGELSFPDSQTATSEDIEESLLLLSYGINPNITMMDKRDGSSVILNGNRFIRAVIEYVSDLHVYPINGHLESFQGKRFSELTRSDQRKIRTADLTITICTEESGLFSDLSKIAQRLS
ncbi:hypothetical protein J4N45_10465 [Vibrio sp. SCSIO 43140]|uniref:hypothetical protein n=1 Tax=Vibrio sp. SCSIO 43140 TaxID=2819100 RepID=UPI002075B07C|nr:hypothetical protein [Vibrio sp. SCSIO 43140]USD58953.1 hypothetical protein J4N45_10465 [Vibrio sp. SCSIO 43140]